MTRRQVEEGPADPNERGLRDPSRDRVSSSTHVFHTPKGRTMQRACFQLQVKPDRVAEYAARHREVWPEMLRALADAGWHNYSLFLRPDGLLIGYVETASLAEAVAAMGRTDVNARWQAEMGEYFEELDGVPPDRGFLLLEEVFHLEDQLARHPGGSDDHSSTPTRSDVR